MGTFWNVIWAFEKVSYFFFDKWWAQNRFNDSSCCAPKASSVAAEEKRPRKSEKATSAAARATGTRRCEHGRSRWESGWASSPGEQEPWSKNQAWTGILLGKAQSAAPLHQYAVETPSACVNFPKQTIKLSPFPSPFNIWNSLLLVTLVNGANHSICDQEFGKINAQTIAPSRSIIGRCAKRRDRSHEEIRHDHSKVTEYFSLWRPRCVLGKAQGVQPGKFRGHFNFTKKSGDELLQMGQAPGKKLNSWNICEYFAKTAAENEAKSLNNYFSLLLIWFWTHTRRLSSRLIMPHFWRTFSRAVVPFTHNFSLFF